jgi:hypothetical protein
MLPTHPPTHLRTSRFRPSHRILMRWVSGWVSGWVGKRPDDEEPMTTRTTAHLTMSWRTWLGRFFRHHDPWLLIALIMMALPLLSAA